MNRIMLVDDEEGILRSLRRLLIATPVSHGGIVYPVEVEIFSSPRQALERARHKAFDLFLVDYRMPEMDGVALLKAIRDIQPNAARIILSGYADLNGLVGAINEAQIYRFLSKPWNDYELISTIGQALAYRQLLAENERLADQARLEQGRLSPEEAERRRLETLEPGITRVNWGPDGSVILDDEFRDPYNDEF
ncbi:MAG: response regulator [Candidatus Nitricoxidivorans perseverans]|uniref:Response regulator n=1 Tax=Candidatus Nitricoxidivorans perseverans TaxID=2975601 RepID=A0AA49FL75_9PROT|nr:MAG: response regulator [Candidatus Nitricoxidivorans perseverans]